MLTQMLFMLTMIAQGPTCEPPEVVVRGDDTVIKESCRVVIAKDAVIEDRNGNGVIHVQASDIVVEFAEGAVLRGAKEDRRPDEMEGYGIRITGQKNVTVRGAKIHGYRCAIWASKAPGLMIEDADASHCRRQHLKSTPAAEDGGDWLFPHQNDENEWLKNYAAAMYIEDSDQVTVRRCKVRNGQNGLCLDRVTESKIYDNDFSFLSGWGLALWRSSKNVISRNAVDFCVRGYSHGVYNRGQDSAGILMFEQCCENVLAENSVTHGGDGFFGFGGREALGEVPAPRPDFDHRRRGNNDNLLVKNDLSYAPAHGIEMTFSFGNRFIANRLIGNAICGVWGGYSQDTLMAENEFADNGGMAYGLERGGVNIEHGRGNRVIHNRFKNNACGVHFWWDADGGFAKQPWAKANKPESVDNLIAFNEFVGDKLALHFRGRGHVTIGANKFSGVAKEQEAETDHKLIFKDDLPVEPFEAPEYPVLGDTRPVGARPALRGRENIIMTEWGPWDHESPLVRLIEATGASHVYELHKCPTGLSVTFMGDGLKGQLIPAASRDGAARYVVSASEPGVRPYYAKFSAGGFAKELRGTLLTLSWDVTFFKWTKETDPREKPEDWRRLAEDETAAKAQTAQLTFKYGGGGPSDLKLSDALTKAQLGADYFGMIAVTKVSLAKGQWKIVTTSDDGVRVSVDGKPVIDNWTWHVPTRDEGVFDLPETKSVEIAVEHFEIDGFSTLDFELMPLN